MTSSNWHLQPEHQLLGANIDDALEYVVNYGDREYELNALKSGQAVVDLHGLKMLLIEGADAEYFAQCAFATQPLFVGQNAFSAIFDADGRLLGCPLIMRTGDHEYLVFDKGVQFDNILDWLSVLSQATQQGQRLFTDVNVEERTGYLYPLALCGPGSKEILNDYLKDKEQLSYPGMTTALTLDKIEAIGSRLALEYPIYVLLVPPTMARTLFRSFLSFKNLDTVGFETFWSFLAQNECEFLQLFTPSHSDKETKTFDMDEFIDRGLVRRDANYIGARALLG